MEKVVVQTGAKTYQIADQDGNDLGVFRFIPSDAGILKRYKEATAFFAGINDRIKGKDFEEILPELEKEAGEKIDLLFGAPVSEKFFKITSPFTVLESGETFAEQIITVMRLNKGFIIKSPQNKLFYCPSNLLDELIEDVMDYALMRLDKRLLPQCHEPNDSELEAAGLTPEGAYVPPTLSLRHLKIPDLNFLREFSHSSTESKNNNSNDYTEE